MASVDAAAGGKTGGAPNGWMKQTAIRLPARRMAAENRDAGGIRALLVHFDSALAKENR
ncbi:hypothetical protein [Chromobacterium sphagni]|uniref:hypothetical protein n=1 Tax=Chromobacterium sphagni TaxID=1903179 RepID=UPI0019D325C5|nr:hypothetical protein [Chromobacterium sphagni]